MRSRQRGLILVVVLWVSALLALLAGSFTFGVQTETRLATFYRQKAEARAIAEAAVTFFGVLLSGEAERAGLPLNGVAVAWEFSGREVSVRVIDASGLVDLNQASRGLLTRAVLWAGVEQGEEGIVVDGLLDWRDPDNLRQLNGAEDDDYLRAGLPAGAKDAAFEAEEEVGQVLGIDAAVARRLAMISTVHGSAGVNPDAAPAEVLAMLAGLDDQEVLPEVRMEGDDVDAAEAVPSEHYRGGEIGVFHVLVDVSGTSGERYGFVAVVEPRAGEPAQVLSWRE